jgi:serine O-acetyltransferase
MNRAKNRIQISRKTKIGYGLYIGHNGPIVVNPKTMIGNNCNLSQFTTIGSNHGKAATIGDNTYIGPNCCIIEDLKIGNNVTIGAGSVVTKDIPDWCVAVGNPCRVLRMITEEDKKKLFKNEEIDEEAWNDIVSRGFVE